ncbi:MAG: DUF3300 domain-containing protein [Geminicoccaceae bacterium]
MSWRAAMSALTVALAVCLATKAGHAQDQAADEVVEASSDDLEALVAPVALFPDPILMLVLQGSVLPLQIVQADRFLDAHAKDASREPPDGLDPAVMGLLNYPDVVGQMSDYLDWTQSMGEAVVDQLDEVQVAIQDVRQTAYGLGMLKTTDQQKVIVEDDVIRIMPASKDKVVIPIYDAGALLEAGAAAEEAAVAIQEPAPATAAPAPASAPAPAAAPAPASTQAFAPEPASTTAPIAYAPAAVAPPPVAYSAPQSSFWSTAATFAGGAAVGGLLGYVLSDDDNDDIDWDDINDEMEDLFDDQFDDFADDMRDEIRNAIDDNDIEELSDRLNGRDVNISDSNIVVGNQMRQRESIQNELRARQEGTKQGLGTRKEREKKLAELREKGGDGGLTLPRAAGPKPAKAAAPRLPQRADAAPKVKRQVELPKGAGTRRDAAAAAAPKSVKQIASVQQRAKVEGRPRPQTLGTKAPAQTRDVTRPRPNAAAMAAAANPRRQVNRDSDRGQASRAAAAKLGNVKLPQAARGGGDGPKLQRPGGSGGSRGGNALKNVGGSGKAAKIASDRGKQSRGGGEGGRRRKG